MLPKKAYGVIGLATVDLFSIYTPASYRFAITPNPTLHRIIHTMTSSGFWQRTNERYGI
jgi:hypothetical protein